MFSPRDSAPVIGKHIPLNSGSPVLWGRTYPPSVVSPDADDTSDDTGFSGFLSPVQAASPDNDTAESRSAIILRTFFFDIFFSFRGGMSFRRLQNQHHRRRRFVVRSARLFSDSPDNRTLLLSMIKNDFIEMTEEKGLIVGLKGERLINSFKFYAVFKDSEDYTVRAGSDEIGTITTPPPVGDRFALAGRVWEVEELDVARKLIYVKEVKGKMEISWPGDYGEIHTRILERMKQVLEEDTVYPYLKKNARKRLDVARRVARNTGMLKKSIVHLGGYTWCLFPWLGTRSFRTLRKFIAKNGAKFRISGMEYEGCCYMTFKMERGDGRELISYLSKKASTEGIDKSALVAPSECPVFEKYDDFIPSELLRDAYMADRLRTDEAVKRLAEIAWELGKQ